MTKWQEFPLRPQGQPWPGLNTRGGLLDPGGGQLEDGSFNQLINEGDLLEKRKGFIRGLEERFDGPVCGLFAYTDECGREFLIVADQLGIKVRAPFNIPLFLGSDGFPNDIFNETLSTERWRNTTDYETFESALRLVSAALATTGETTPESRHLNWFKDAPVPSYFVLIGYEFARSSSKPQVASAIMRKNGTTAYLIGDVVFNSGLSTYKVVVRLVEGATTTDLLTVNLTGIAAAAGQFTLTFNAATRTITVRVLPTGGTIVTQSVTITELQTGNLGQGTSIGLAYSGGTPPPESLRILEVISGTI